MTIKKGILFYYLMIVPAAVVTGIVFIYPLGQTFYLSFFSYGPIYGKKFLGLTAYFRVLSDQTFIATVIRSLIYTGGVVSANLVIGMGYALLTYKAGKAIKMLRVILILPMLFMPAAAGITWVMLYNEDVGLINLFLESIGLKKGMWLAWGKTGFPAVMITDIWAWTPFVYLILLAGLESLPLEPLEAAEVDGASSRQKLWYVIIPMMRPVIAVAAVIKSIDTFRTFAYIWVMTRGGPGDSTQVISTLIFSRSFRRYQFGLGSTMAVISILIVLVLFLILAFIFKENIRVRR